MYYFHYFNINNVILDSQAAYTSYLEDKNVEKHFMRNNNTDESLMFLNSDIPLNSSIGLNIAGSPLVSLQNSKVASSVHIIYNYNYNYNYYNVN